MAGSTNNTSGGAIVVGNSINNNLLSNIPGTRTMRRRDSEGRIGAGDNTGDSTVSG